MMICMLATYHFIWWHFQSVFIRSPVNWLLQSLNVETKLKLIYLWNLCVTLKWNPEAWLYFTCVKYCEFLWFYLPSYSILLFQVHPNPKNVQHAIWSFQIGIHCKLIAVMCIKSHGNATFVIRFLRRILVWRGTNWPLMKARKIIR